MSAWFTNGDGTSTGSPVGSVCTTDSYKDQCGSGYYWNAVLSVCEPTKEECPAGQVMNSNKQCAPEPCPEGMVQQQDKTCKAKENECSAGQIKSPDGSCIKDPQACGTGKAQGSDGTCKPDKDGDGVPDDEDSDDDGEDDKKSFSGGDDCSSPPSCSGDPIMCGQARIQWRIDCNTRKNRNIAGGSCAAIPICTGEKCDALEYSSLLFQWRTACATEKLLAKDGGNSESGQPDWTKVSGDGTAGAGADPDKPHRTVALGLNRLDQGGFFGGNGACPKFGTVDVWKFGKVDIDQFPWICQFFAAVRIVLIGIGAFIAFGILAGRIF